MFDTLSQFRDAIRSTGLVPPDVIELGKIHRFPGIGKNRSNRAGWCKFFNDGLGGCFGDWASGFSENWQAKRKKSFSRSDRAAFMRRMVDARAPTETKRQTKQADAANRASKIWSAATPAASGHSYLIRKGIKVHGARSHNGSLMLPVMDFSGNLTTLQFIAANGSKLLLSGGRKRGCFIPVAGNMADATRVIICEGWATGCTLAGDEPAALVLAAIDAGNLEPVALAARHCWPFSDLVIAGDDDRRTPGNPGATKARSAAIAADALLALPQWPAGSPKTLTDFNDLAVWLATDII